jgi:hypothetical protein
MNIEMKEVFKGVVVLILLMWCWQIMEALK